MHLQLKFDEIKKDYLTQTLFFLSRSWIEEKKTLTSEDWINSFILTAKRKYSNRKGEFKMYTIEFLLYIKIFWK